MSLKTELNMEDGERIKKMPVFFKISPNRWVLLPAMHSTFINTDNVTTFFTVSCLQALGTQIMLFFSSASLALTLVMLLPQPSSHQYLVHLLYLKFFH